MCFVVFGCAAAASAQGPDAGADVAAAVDSEPGPSVAQEAREAQQAQDDQDARERLELTGAISALDALLGSHQVVVDPTQLLGVDPVDSDAVSVRLAELRDALAGAEAAVAEERAAAQEAQEAQEAQGAREAREAREPHGDPADSPAAPGVPDDAPAVDAPPPATLAELRETRLLRLIAFLELPLHERATAVADDDASRSLAHELASADAQGVEAIRVQAEAADAEQRALAEATQASEAAARELVGERARAESLRGELAQASGTLARRRHRLARIGQTWSALASEIDVVVTHGQPTPGVADALYDRVALALDQSRGSFDRAISDLDAPTGFPTFELALDPAAPRYQGHPTEREALLRVVQAVGEARDAVSTSEGRFRWTRAKSLATHVSNLEEARQQLLPRTSAAKRDRLLSLGPEGITQLRREAYHLSLEARWYLRTRPATIASLPGWFGTELAHSASRWALLQLLLLVMAVVLLALRRDRLTAWFSQVLTEAADTPDGLATAQRWSRTFSAVAVPLLMLLGAYAGFALARTLGDPPELELARSLVLALLWFGLVISTIHYAIIGFARAHRANLPPSLSGRILSSIRFVAAYVLFAVILTIVDRQLIGHGYIQELVVEFAWMGAVPIALIILRRWRVEITDTYVARYPRSQLSRGLERARGRFWDVVVLVPAVVRLVGAGVLLVIEDTALRFDRVRRGLAYLFRRRLEKSAETIGRGTANATDLPTPLRRAFGPGELHEETKVPHFPGLPKTLEAVSAWQAGGVATSMALVGPVGVGKTTWMEELRGRVQDQGEDAERAGPAGNGREKLEIVEAVLEDSLEDERAVCIALSHAFGLETPLEDVETLVQTFLEMKPRLVLLDHCQNLHLRCVGGFAGFRAFAVIVRRTSERFFWISSFSLYAFEHLTYVAGATGSLFMRVQYLRGWSEEELGQLIDKRMARAGVAASYEDLLPARVEGAEREAELVRTRERYLRLLWDYSDGLPRVALHYWLRSLVATADDVVSVRLFDAPHADDLEHIAPVSRFLMHAVISHENLSVAEAARVLATPLDELNSLFEMLRLQGYLSRTVDRYRVTTRWDRAVVSYLRRKHLLYS